MKTALLYSGQARSFHQIWENHRWYLKRFPNPEIFSFVADDERADDMKLLERAFPGRPCHLGKGPQPTIEEPVELTRFRSGYPRSTTLQGVLKQLWALSATWEFFCQNAVPSEYDMIVRMRPDTAFVRIVEPPAHMGIWSCYTPSWARWGGVNDRFAILGHEAASHYFLTFLKRERLWDAGCPRHPEQMVLASLEDGGITPVDTNAYEFVTVREPSAQHPNGGYYPIDCSALDVLDMARKAL